MTNDPDQIRAQVAELLGEPTDAASSDPAAELGGQGRDPGIGDAARHDRAERPEVAVAVQREAVQGGGACHPDPDGGDLAGRATLVGRDPHPGPPLDPAGRQAHVGAHRDQRLFESPHEIDHVQRFGQPDDRIADQLTGAVPGDLAAAVGVDDRGAVLGTLLGQGAPPGGVGGGMLEQQQRIGAAGRPGVGEFALQLPGGPVVDRSEPTHAHRRTV